MRLGGTVAMEGTWEVEAEMTAEAGMCATSWSMLGLVGSSIKGMEARESPGGLVQEAFLSSILLMWTSLRASFGSQQVGSDPVSWSFTAKM